MFDEQARAARYALEADGVKRRLQVVVPGVDVTAKLDQQRDGVEAVAHRHVVERRIAVRAGLVRVGAAGHQGARRLRLAGQVDGAQRRTARIRERGRVGAVREQPAHQRAVTASRRDVQRRGAAVVTRLDAGPLRDQPVGHRDPVVRGGDVQRREPAGAGRVEVERVERAERSAEPDRAALGDDVQR